MLSGGAAGAAAAGAAARLHFWVAHITTLTPAPIPPSPLQGFMFGDKLLRPAMVKVSYSDSPAAAGSSADDAAASGASD